MKIGILGGGQLSRMLALAGIPLGLQFVFYFPKYQHALDQLGEIQMAEYDDWKCLEAFAKQVDVITYENENIPQATLEFIEQIKPIYPNKRAILMSQDRLQEKNFFRELNIPTNKYIEVNKKNDLFNAMQEFDNQLILKKRTHGYDGKGQVKITKKTQFDEFAEEHCQHCIAEEIVPFTREVSVIAARTQQGDTAFYDLSENVHKNGILFKTVNRINDPMFELAQSYMASVFQALDYVGVLAIEFFQVNDQLIANEMAPRVHNSGHWTIDAAVTSQFENHLRCITNLPLGDASSLTTSIMLNILQQMPDKNKLLAFPGLKLHDYCKAPAVGRKLGHVTLLKSLALATLSELEKMLELHP